MNATKAQIKFCERISLTPATLGMMPGSEHHQPDVAPVDFSTQPGNGAETAKANSRLVEALADSKVFREYQRAFGEALGLPLTLRAVEGWQLAHQGNRHQNGFCAMMSRTNQSCAACLRMQ